MDIQQLLAMSRGLFEGSSTQKVHKRGYNLFGFNSVRAPHNYPNPSSKRGKFKPRTRCHKVKG